MTTSVTPVDRTPRRAYFGLFAVEYFLYVTLRSGLLDSGIYVGFHQPSASSLHAWVVFVQNWNHAMMLLFPAIVLGVGAMVFGRIGLLALSRFAQGRRIELTFANTFMVGVHGFLIPAVAAHTLSKLFAGHPEATLLPFIANAVIFMSYSRKAMWKSLFLHFSKEARKAR